MFAFDPESPQIVRPRCFTEVPSYSLAAPSVVQRSLKTVLSPRRNSRNSWACTRKSRFRITALGRNKKQLSRHCKGTASITRRPTRSRTSCTQRSPSASTSMCCTDSGCFQPVGPVVFCQGSRLFLREPILGNEFSVARPERAASHLLCRKLRR